MAKEKLSPDGFPTRSRSAEIQENRSVPRSDLTHKRPHPARTPNRNANPSGEILD